MKILTCNISKIKFKINIINKCFDIYTSKLIIMFLYNVFKYKYNLVNLGDSKTIVNILFSVLSGYYPNLNQYQWCIKYKIIFFLFLKFFFG